MYFPPIKNSEQITKDPTLRVIRPWWVILGGAAILYLAPAQQILELPLVGATVDWLASLIPSIARWVELSPFPDNTKLFAVFVWMMILVQAYWLIASTETRRFYQESYLIKSSQQTRIVRVFAFLCFFAFFCGFVFLTYSLAIVDTPPCRVCVNTSKWAQLFIGCLTSVATSGLIAVLASNVPLLIKSLTSKGNNHV